MRESKPTTNTNNRIPRDIPTPMITGAHTTHQLYGNSPINLPMPIIIVAIHAMDIRLQPFDDVLSLMRFQCNVYLQNVKRLIFFFWYLNTS